MIKPFKGTLPISQVFGVNKGSYSQFGLEGHNGIDYAMPTGTPIYAPHSGKVIEALYDAGGYGMYIKIENEKEGSVLAHLKSFNVNAGDVLTEGTQIGISDNTGNSTGPHLHHGWYLIPRDRSNGYNGFQDQLVLEKAVNIGYFPKPSGDVENLNRIIKEKEIMILGLNGQIKTLQTKIEGFQTELTNKLADKDRECQEKLRLQIEKVINFAHSL